MTTYKDLKSVKYIESIINYAEGLRKFNFKRTGKNRYSAHCPFHVDNKDSFRVYVDGKDEVRFKCFGACQGGADDEKANWDIYDLIMITNKCSFREAQIAFSKYMGVEDFTPYSGTAEHRPTPTEIAEPDEPVNFAKPKKLDPKIIQALGEASIFYNEMLLNNSEEFHKVHNYLLRRGINTDLIKKFNIGFTPTLRDEEYQGRALIKNYLKRFNADYTEFYPFYKGSLVRLLNDGSFYMQFIDFGMRSHILLILQTQSFGQGFLFHAACGEYCGEFIFQKTKREL